MSPTSADLTLASYTADLLAIRDQWDLILGHSLGGAIAVLALKERPNLAPVLILEDPAVAIPAPEFAIENLLKSYVAPISQEEVSRRNPTWHREDCRIKVSAIIESRPAMVEQTIRQNVPWSLIEEVVALEVPTLILGAEFEPVVPAQFGRDLAGMNSNLTFHQVGGSSHSMHRDEFDAFWARVVEFLP